VLAGFATRGDRSLTVRTIGQAFPIQAVTVATRQWHGRCSRRTQERPAQRAVHL